MSSENVMVEMERSNTGMGIRKVAQWVKPADFTDGGGASGTLVLRKKIPAGSFVIGSKVTVKKAWSGDTSCVMDIGDGSDADIFSYTTHNLFTAATNLVEAADAGNAGTESGLVPISSETTVTLTVTSDSDFGAISTAARAYVEVFYLSTNVELTDKSENKYKSME